MSLTMTEANALLANVSTDEDLRNLIAQLDVAGSGSTTLLYSGDIVSGGKAHDIALEFSEQNANIRIIDNTEAGKFLDYKTNETLGLKLRELFGPEFETRGSTGNKFLYGENDGTGVWASTSQRFVGEAVGEVRVLGPGASASGVFALVELPTLLKNPNITAVEGIDIQDLRALEANGENILKYIKDVSVFHTVSCDLKITEINGQMVLSGADDYLYRITDVDFSKLGEEYPEGAKRLTEFLTSSEAGKWVDIEDVAKRMETSGGILKGLNRLSWIASIFVFFATAQEAADAHALGKEDEAKEIMQLWAVEAVGGALGAKIGATIGGIVLAALGLTAGAVPASAIAALILGGAAIGGLFGSDAATDWYELNKDKDQNTIIEMMNKLTDLIFGKDADADISLPKDLDGNQLTLLVNTGEKGIAAAIAGQAKQAENIEWRYALRELNPFAVPNIDYEQYNQDGSLDLYDPKNAPNGMSAEYIEKRAELLILMLSDKPEDNALFKQLLSQGNWDFIDLSENIHIHIGETEKRNARAAGSGLAHQVIFGTDESDDLTGNAGKDWLFGGKGGDTLNGGEGDDYLEGGEGDDTYHIEGSDTVRDTDGSGKLLFNNGDTPNKPLSADGANANRWISLDDSGNPIIGFLAYRIGGNDLLLINQKTGDKVLIKDYFLQADANSNGYSGVLGIELQTQEQSKDGYKIYNGDQKPPLNSDDPNYRGDYPDNYDWSKVHYDTATGELIGGIFSSGFADVIRGSAEKDLMQGFDGDDAIDGGDGDDIIYGNEGDDLLVGGSGADQIYGGDGNDWIASSSYLYIARRIGEKDQWIPPQDAKEIVKAGPLWGMYDNGYITIWSISATQTKTDISESDMVVGGNGNDNIIGGWANDYLLGDDFEEGDKDGNDYIQGLAGDDVIYGGGGDDFLEGDGTTVSGILNTVAGEYHGKDYLDGGSGDDEIRGGGNNDTLYGGDGDDWLEGDGKESVIAVQYHGNDYLYGGSGNDHMAGNGGDDWLFGGEGDDVLWGDASEGNNQLNQTQIGNDYLFGEASDDEIYGGFGDDTLDGGAGDDELYGGQGSDQLYGGEGNDILLGDDFVEGNQHNQDMAGNDTLYGYYGDDVLNGGDGNEENAIKTLYHGNNYLGRGSSVACCLEIVKKPNFTVAYLK